MRGDDLRNLKEDEEDERERSDGEREEKGSVALVAEEMKRVVDEAEEETAAAVAAALPKAVAAMDFVEVEFFEAATGNECEGSVSNSDKFAAIWGFPYSRLLSFGFGSTWPTRKILFGNAVLLIQSRFLPIIPS